MQEIGTHDASFWETDAGLDWHETANVTETVFDVVIVGGGLLGCAISRILHQEAPDLSCVVIERGRHPIGASSRNAGFACFGSVGEIAADIDRMGAAAAKALVASRWKGLQQLRAMVRDDAIAFEQAGGHEIFTSDHPALDRITEVNNLLEPIFNQPPFALRDSLIQVNGLSARVRHLIHTPFEGMLHSGLLMKQMEPHTLLHATVLGLQQENTGNNTSTTEDTGDASVSQACGIADGEWKVTIESHRGGMPVVSTIKARQVVLATNAWLPDLLPGADVRPARGQVLVTELLPQLALRGTFHMDEGFVYFRNVGNRVLLGGARNLAFEQERTTALTTTANIQQHLETLLHDIILPDTTPKIEMRWAGTMAFTSNHQPKIEQVQSRLIMAITCNGMGVALASSIATNTVAVVLQNASST